MERMAEKSRAGRWKECEFLSTSKEEPGRLQSTGSLRVGHD